MDTQLKELIVEYLKQEGVYSDKDIEQMLKSAHIERIDNNVFIAYENGVTETLTIETKQYLKQLTFTTP